MFQYARLPTADAAHTTSADAVETQIGTGIRVPNWCRSVQGMYVLPTLETATADEVVSGYIRIYNDEETMNPNYWPLPQAQALGGDTGTLMSLPIYIPIEYSLTKNDTIRAACAFDNAQTGTHGYSVILVLSSNNANHRIHAQMSGVQVQGTTEAVAAATAETISTIAGKVSGIVGAWAYCGMAAGITAAQSGDGYVRITSDAAGWLTQRVPFGGPSAGIGANIDPIVLPTLALQHELYAGRKCNPSGVNNLDWPDKFPIDTTEPFTFVGFMNDTCTDAADARFGLIWEY